MAIRRCPYCKAIIDESQKYCNNCGTQLLFPEEEGAEEDIKGEKILDEDVVPGPEDEPEDAAEAAPEEIDLEDVIQGKGEFPGEKPDVSETGASGRRGEEGGEVEAKEEVSAAESGTPGEGFIKSAEELLGRVPEPDLDLREKDENEDEVDEDKGAANGLDFDAKGEIVQLMAELEKRKAAQTSESVPPGLSKTGTEDLPPWAEVVKESAPATEAAAPSGEAKASRGEAGKEVLGSEGFAPGDTMDFRNDVMRRAEGAGPSSSTMGIPESVTKMGEPGKRPGLRLEEAAIGEPLVSLGDEREGEEEIPVEVEADVEAAEAGAEGVGESEERPAEAVRPTFAESEKLGFIGTIKAFLFDAAFVAFLWLIAAGLAAGLMKVGLVRLVGEAPLSFGLLFLALFAGYFFLFLFFLGETLGRRLAASKD